MSEKKRVRPTLGQVKELEAEIERLRLLNNVDGCYDKKLEAERDEWKRKFEEQLEGTSVLVKDCDAWREKYRELNRKYEEQIEGTSKLVSDCDTWRENYRDLEKELSDVREAYASTGIQCAKLKEELEALKSRGFWARLINRQ